MIEERQYLTQKQDSQTQMAARHHFRYYTRQIRILPSHEYYHKKRIKAACQFEQSEPLQGALADYFFAHWYDMAAQGHEILDEVSEYLPNHVMQEFLKYINKGHHLFAITPLATRWSVLVSPSMNVPKHKLYMSKDDAKLLAQQISHALLAARQDGQVELMAQLEQQYLQHCQACQDRMGFMLVYFALMKESWVFSQEWNLYKQSLELDVTEKS